ncbi:MAG: FAD-dependent oxidoreductase [Clostridia bacterium]|nr:FAD-dependent oxidoreductase [Clostridia bacterium]
MKNIVYGHCIKGIKGNPVQVPKLEKYVNLWAREKNIEYIPSIKKANNIKIAVIGAGPSGIACSVELAKNGFDVTIFEKETEIGGLLTYGIPGFRLPRDITKNLTARIKKLGIKIKTNIELGKNIGIEQLKKQGYRAIFIGIGADIPVIYTLNNKKCDKIYKSNYILKEYNSKKRVKDLGNVIVIGGGNVATDCSRAVMRMGAKSSTIIYRRDKNKMPAREIELEEAIKDGVNIIYNTKVIDAEIKNEKLEQVKCIKTDTRSKEVLDIENSEFYLKADSIVFAIGLKPDKNLINNEELEFDENGLIKTDDNCMTNIDGVFAGGDVTQNKATVCMAIKSGKSAAKSIQNYLEQKI